MKKLYVYRSITLHIAVFLLCVIEVSFFNSKRDFEELPPIIVDLENIKIAETTNLPEKAVFGKEKKPATRKEKPVEENYAPAAPKPEPKAELPKPEPKPEPKAEAPEIKAPALIEETPQIKEEPKKESKEPLKEKKKPAPVPQKKPQPKPLKKPQPAKKPEPKKAEQKKTTPANNAGKEQSKSAIKATNPLASLMNSVDDLQKQIGEEDAPAQIPEEAQVTNMGIEGGSSKGSYFSELSISGVDLVRSTIQEHWKIISGSGNEKNVNFVINVKLSKDGSVLAVTPVKTGGAPQTYVEAAIRAIRHAEDYKNEARGIRNGVFRFLATQNASSYEQWKSIDFTFTPLGIQ